MDLDWTLRPELARAVVAGWLTGVMIGLICLGIVMIGLARDPSWSARMPRVKVSLPVFGIIVANGMMFGWTLVGVLLGFAYAARPGLAFSVGLFALAILGGGLYWIMRSSAHGSEPFMVWGCLVVAVLGFGVGMPLLIEVM